jgi:hypothetical protein
MEEARHQYSNKLLYGAFYYWSMVNLEAKE